METLTIKYWQRLFSGFIRESKVPTKSTLLNNEKDAKKLYGKIINYRRNRKPELF